MKHVDENNECFHLFICIHTYEHILKYFVLTRRNQLPFSVTESLKRHQEITKMVIIFLAGISMENIPTSFS